MTGYQRYIHHHLLAIHLLLTHPASSQQDLPKPSRIGIDPRLIPFSEYQTISEKLAKSSSEQAASTLVSVDENLVDAVWEAEKGSAKGRPERVASEVFILEEKYAGELASISGDTCKLIGDDLCTTGQSSKDKLEALRVQLAKSGAEGLVVSMLDEVAWLFNLRGADIAYNPVRPNFPRT
jgi:Xaa-Pro aminopeptidase